MRDVKPIRNIEPIKRKEGNNSYMYFWAYNKFFFFAPNKVAFWTKNVIPIRDINNRDTYKKIYIVKNMSCASSVFPSPRLLPKTITPPILN
ncbi:hypothetical protein AN396_04000 [Candidatus Epulonipiscium fishelsonii]|uniref:Uncharacterized protein n=1 Tax=Candidatus Epulonipiscium fishelsonii TaxID=77094 RepID=A0ACC8XE09_9FIRM|nr:hypothetical protein AN396_04000 [Epulopiscium sp. SCG-B11WGA-EpuloA1]